MIKNNNLFYALHLKNYEYIDVLIPKSGFYQAGKRFSLGIEFYSLYAKGKFTILTASNKVLTLGIDNGIPYFEHNNMSIRCDDPSSLMIQSGSWNTIYITHDGQTLRMYLNGYLCKESKGGSNFSLLPGTQLCIGKSIEMYVRSCQIYNDNLSAAQVLYAPYRHGINKQSIEMDLDFTLINAKDRGINGLKIIYNGSSSRLSALKLEEDGGITLPNSNELNQAIYNGCFTTFARLFTFYTSKKSILFTNTDIADPRYQFAVAIDATKNNLAYLELVVGNRDKFTLANEIVKLPYEKWSNIAVSVSLGKKLKTVSFYLDGNNILTMDFFCLAEASPRTFCIGGGPQKIGQENYSSFTGYIDSFAFVKRTIMDNEINQIANQYNNIPPISTEELCSCCVFRYHNMEDSQSGAALYGKKDSLKWLGRYKKNTLPIVALTGCLEMQSVSLSSMKLEENESTVLANSGEIKQICTMPHEFKSNVPKITDTNEDIPDFANQSFSIVAKIYPKNGDSKGVILANSSITVFIDVSNQQPYLMCQLHGNAKVINMALLEYEKWQIVCLTFNRDLYDKGKSVHNDYNVICSIEGKNTYFWLDPPQASDRFISLGNNMEGTCPFYGYIALVGFYDFAFTSQICEFFQQDMIPSVYDKGIKALYDFTGGVAQNLIALSKNSLSLSLSSIDKNNLNLKEIDDGSLTLGYQISASHAPPREYNILKNLEEEGYALHLERGCWASAVLEPQLNMKNPISQFSLSYKFYLNEMEPSHALVTHGSDFELGLLYDEVYVRVQNDRMSNEDAEICIRKNVWNTVCMVFNDGTAQVYINGEKTVSLEFCVQSLDKLAGIWRFGGITDQYIRSLRIYDRCLRQDEVQYDFECTRGENALLDLDFTRANPVDWGKYDTQVQFYGASSRKTGLVVHSNSKIDILTRPIFGFLNFTVVAKINIWQENTSNMCIFSLEDEYSSYLEIMADTSNKSYACIQLVRKNFLTNSNTSKVIEGAKISYGKWINIAISRQNKKYYLYINGNLVLCDAEMYNFDIHHLYVGSGRVGAVLNGYIDSVAIFPKALTDDQAKQYSNGVYAFEPDTIYTFGNGDAIELLSMQTVDIRDSQLKKMRKGSEMRQELPVEFLYNTLKLNPEETILISATDHPNFFRESFTIVMQICPGVVSKTQSVFAFSNLSVYVRPYSKSHAILCFNINETKTTEVSLISCGEWATVGLISNFDDWQNKNIESNGDRYNITFTINDEVYYYWLEPPMCEPTMFIMGQTKNMLAFSGDIRYIAVFSDVLDVSHVVGYRYEQLIPNAEIVYHFANNEIILRQEGDERKAQIIAIEKNARLRDSKIIPYDDVSYNIALSSKSDFDGENDELAALVFNSYRLFVEQFIGIKTSIDNYRQEIGQYITKHLLHLTEIQSMISEYEQKEWDTAVIDAMSLLWSQYRTVLNPFVCPAQSSALNWVGAKRFALISPENRPSLSEIITKPLAPSIGDQIFNLIKDFLNPKYWIESFKTNILGVEYIPHISWVVLDASKNTKCEIQYELKLTKIKDKNKQRIAGNKVIIHQTYYINSLDKKDQIYCVSTHKTIKINGLDIKGSFKDTTLFRNMKVGRNYNVECNDYFSNSLYNRSYFNIHVAARKPCGNWSILSDGQELIDAYKICNLINADYNEEPLSEHKFAKRVNTWIRKSKLFLESADSHYSMIEQNRFDGGEADGLIFDRNRLLDDIESGEPIPVSSRDLSLLLVELARAEGFDSLSLYRMTTGEEILIGPIDKENKIAYVCAEKKCMLPLMINPNVRKLELESQEDKNNISGLEVDTKFQVKEHWVAAKKSGDDIIVYDAIFKGKNEDGIPFVSGIRKDKKTSNLDLHLRMVMKELDDECYRASVFQYGWFCHLELHYEKWRIGSIEEYPKLMELIDKYKKINFLDNDRPGIEKAIKCFYNPVSEQDLCHSFSFKFMKDAICGSYVYKMLDESIRVLYDTVVKALLEGVFCNNLQEIEYDDNLVDAQLKNFKDEARKIINSDEIDDFRPHKILYYFNNSIYNYRPANMSWNRSVQNFYDPYKWTCWVDNVEIINNSGFLNRIPENEGDMYMSLDSIYDNDRLNCYFETLSSTASNETEIPFDIRLLIKFGFGLINLIPDNLYYYYLASSNNEFKVGANIGIWVPEYTYCYDAYSNQWSLHRIGEYQF